MVAYITASVASARGFAAVSKADRLTDRGTRLDLSKAKLKLIVAFLLA